MLWHAICKEKQAIQLISLSKHEDMKVENKT